ncbi:MAG: OmpA family protein [Rhodoferax sp.]
MKTTASKILLSCSMLFITACASTPVSTSLLDQARADYALAQSTPKVTSYAPLEMQSATEALGKANTAATARESSDAVDQLAYLAKQKIALAMEVASRKSAEADVANTAAVRDQIRLDQRTQQADQARLKAQEAERSAQAARDAALLATQQKNTAQANALQAQQIAADASAKTLQLEAQLAELAAKKTERGLIITLGDVLFATDVARLNANGLVMAQRLATVLQQNPQRTVLIEGFTDSTGKAQYNQDLSERRAMAVAEALLAQGVARERIRQRGYGESYPVAANDTAQNRQLNRRVEIVLSDDRGVIPAR